MKIPTKRSDLFQEVGESIDLARGKTFDCLIINQLILG